MDIRFCWILGHVHSGQSLEGSGLFLRFLSVVACFWTFWIDALNRSGKTWRRFPHDLVLRVRPNTISSISLVDNFPRPFGCYRLAAFLWDTLGPMVPFWCKGLWSFWRAALVLRVMSLGVNSLTPCLVVPWWRKYRGVNFYSLQQDFFFIAIFPLII